MKVRIFWHRFKNFIVSLWKSILPDWTYFFSFRSDKTK